MAGSLVLTRAVGAHVVEITMADDEHRNAVGPAMIDALLDAFAAATATGCRAAVLRARPGSGTWSAGYDIASLPHDLDAARTWHNPLEDLLTGIEQVPFPVIAAVGGGVWGGAVEVVLACDLVVAVRGSTFAITPARLGVPYGRTGVARFLASLPVNVAREMLFTADVVDAVVLAAYGVVNRVVETDEELTDVAAALATRITDRAPLAIAVLKAQIAADRSGSDPDTDAHLADLRLAAWASSDYQEGRAAFAQRRAPRFTGT